ncbi:MAG TPA: biotin/lipoyl-binding protein [Candidatus Obscuribacter sp.]|nr:biotin/lipoyl-binding protein [Candidatus Obscuribacter sp.]HNG76365.1 biotin/lipoyl-binding protein [Candidatus Obscuribacter sp.]
MTTHFLGDTIAMKQICSMMAGVVVELLVKPGDSVEDGMDVAILESMKMQLPVASTETGKVEEIKVTSGDFVNEGDLLMILS